MSDMKCPHCGHKGSMVVDTRDSKRYKASNVIRRRRQCKGCDKKFTTYEQISVINIEDKELIMLALKSLLRDRQNAYSAAWEYAKQHDNKLPDKRHFGITEVQVAINEI